MLKAFGLQIYAFEFVLKSYAATLRLEATNNKLR